MTTLFNSTRSLNPEVHISIRAKEPVEVRREQMTQQTDTWREELRDTINNKLQGASARQKAHLRELQSAIAHANHMKDLHLEDVLDRKAAEADWKETTLRKAMEEHEESFNKSFQERMGMIQEERRII